MTPEALRERAIILYERLELMDDGKIDALIAAFIALVAEARREQIEEWCRIVETPGRTMAEVFSFARQALLRTQETTR